MLNKSFFLYAVLISFWLLILIAFSNEDKVLWAKITVPNNGGELFLYQKTRIMHLTPEILVYFQANNHTTLRPIGNILLPEDDRIKLTYNYHWIADYQLSLTLVCDLCMIEERKYELKLGEMPSIVEAFN